jgi:chromosome segregation ATPase
MKITSVLVICLLAFALMVSGCTGTEPVTEPVTESSVMQEYDRHAETLEDDLDEMEAASSDFDTLFAMASADDDYSSEELEPLINQIQEFIEISQRMDLHLDNFESFVDENEVELKELGMDTFEEKNEAGELKLYLTNTIEEFEQLSEELEDLKEQLKALE